MHKSSGTAQILPEEGSHEKRLIGSHFIKETPSRRTIVLPSSLPAMLQAHELGLRAAEAGFDWTRVEDLLLKIEEEVNELRRELQPPAALGSQHPGLELESSKQSGSHFARIEEEVGDLLFAAANLARFLRTDPESCLCRANQKFERRFRALEQEVAKRGKQVKECSASELDEIWEMVKRNATGV
jgi:ATP diphosphatase